MQEQTQIVCKNDVLTFVGSINYANVMSLYEQAILLLKEHSAITINLDAVNSANSAALALLVELKRFALQRNITLSFQQVPDQMLSIAETAGMQDMLV